MSGRPLSDPIQFEVIRRRFNIEVEPMFLTAEAMMTAQPLMLSAGDIPDFFEPGGNENLRKYAYHGYLMELPYDLLLEHAPNIVREINRYAPNIWPSYQLDGHNYGLRPSVWHDGRLPRLGIWRMDWLRAVGIESVPDTLEEYGVALHRFRHDDPDGNGVPDTYGMTGDLLSQYVTFTEVFGAYGVMPYNWMLKDGQVVWGGILPEAKQALALLREWYEDGIIHPDFQTDRWYREIPSKFDNGKVGYVNYMASFEAFNDDNPTSLINKMRTLQPGCELAPGVPPTGPDGLRGHRVWGAAGGGGVMAFGRHMSERPEAVVRLLRMLDAKMTDEAFWRECTIGRQGEHWDWKDPDVGQGSGIRFVPPYDNPQVRERVGLPSQEIFVGGTRAEIMRKYLPRDMIEWNESRRNPAWGRTDLFYSARAVPRAEEFLPDLERMQQMVYADIIVGKAPLEAFDRFVEDWRAAGGEILLKGARETYEDARKILERLSVISDQ
jgi:putative aldouronate transport system substrate-binding protein